MAIIRTVLMEDGSVRGYHEVERITHIVGEKSIIDVLSWTNEAREGGALRSFVERAYDSNMNEADAYAEVSADPMFAEYKDEATEAIEALLPTLTDEQAETVTKFFPAWEVDTAYAVGDRRKYNDKLYRCVQAHTSQEGWEPPSVPALWTRTGADPEEIEVWVQPTGAQDAYNRGDKVHYPTITDPVYMSLIDANVYSPEAYPQGWEVVTTDGDD